MKTAQPVALTIAGFDTSSGAGLQADLLTFHHLGYHALTAVTTLVAETPLQVAGLQPVSCAFLEKQVALLLETYQVAVVKIGLLASAEQAAMLGGLLQGKTMPIVLDPVGIASTGQAMQKQGTQAAILSELAPHTTVLTPNLPEARVLLGSADVRPSEAAWELAERTGAAVLLTGGHQAENGMVTDLLVNGGEEETFSASFIETETVLHGTGCVLASALAAGLGRGLAMREAVESARGYLRMALRDPVRMVGNRKSLWALNHATESR